MKKIQAPFTKVQVENINLFQNRANQHPFTCTEHSVIALIATEDRLYCGVDGCAFVQFWVFDFMAKGNILLPASSLVNNELEQV
jgi:hypothetical protein